MLTNRTALFVCFIIIVLFSLSAALNILTNWYIIGSIILLMTLIAFNIIKAAKNTEEEDKFK